MALTVARHCVAQLDNGLSPLQQDLLTEPRRVRIVDAPTGAGKTYAFQQALLQDQRILFIVPTRRLAQNIAAGLINDLVKAHHWKQETAERKVQVWSSDQTAVLREQGIENIRGYRIRQMQALDGTRSGGEMIVAVPEVVSQLLHRFGLDKGQSGFGVLDILDDFDHIVFDEFHTIEARGFGLAALFAKLVSVTTEAGGNGYGLAKISLLSATPLDIKPVLTKLGVSDSQVAELHEYITPQGRPLHGDVQLVLESLPDMPAVLQQHLDLVREEVTQNRQVVLIYNALADLKRQLPGLIRLLKEAGISAHQVLVINSIDDSGDNTQSGYGYHAGRKQNPDDFSVLIATASVEMGVTFRAANVMLMEPGFAPMNFLQRYGRAARRGEDGAVIVRTDSSLQDRHPWLRELIEWIREQDGATTSIHDLSQVLSRSTQTRFQDGDEKTLYFGALPQQANYASGLYWQVLLRHNSNKTHRREHLLQHQPASSKHVYTLLKQFAALENDSYYQRFANAWRERLFAQALNLRDIGKRVLVIEADGRRLQVDRVWLERETSVMQLPVQYDTHGEEYFQLQGELDDYLLEQKNRASRKLTVYFPHIARTLDLEASNGLLRAWVQHLNNRRDPDTEEAWEFQPEAMTAAEQLVSLTGLVPGADVDLSASTTSMVI